MSAPLHCQECGHQWVPRKRVPRVCAKCRSRFWNRPRPDRRRYGFEPLWRRVRPILGPGYWNDEPTLAELVRHTGIARRQLERYREHGFTEQAADRAAVALGFMPCEIWDEWYDDEEGEAA